MQEEKIETFVLDDGASVKNKKKFNGKKIFIGVGVLLAIVLVAVGVIIGYKKLNKKGVQEEALRAILVDLENSLSSDIEVLDYKQPYFIGRYLSDRFYFYGADGGLKSDNSYDWIDVFGNVFITYRENKTTVVDNSLAPIFEYEDSHVYILSNGKYAVLENENEAFIFDVDGNIVIKGYMSFYIQSGFVVGVKGETQDVYDLELNPILKGVKLVMHNVDQMATFELNKSFILSEKESGYSIYFVGAKRSIDVDYAAIDKNYVAGRDDGEVVLFDKDGKTASTFKNVTGSYGVVTKDILAIEDKTNCTSSDDGNLVLIDKDGKKISGCVSISKDNYDNTNAESVVVKDREKFTIYKNDQKVFEYSGTSNSGIQENEYGNYSYTEYASGVEKLFGIDGSEIYSECKALREIDEGLFECTPTYNINYLYNRDGKLLENSYKEVYRNDTGEFIIVRNDKGKYGLYDKDKNAILEEKYDSFNFNGDILKIELNGKNYYKILKEVKESEYEEFLRANNDIEQDDIQDGKAEDIESIKEKYELGNIESIDEERELFSRFAYHVLNNKKLSDLDRKNLLSMFDAVVDAAKFVDVSTLFKKIDRLEIQLLDDGANLMESSVGEYNDPAGTIKILKNYYNYAIKHEFMHLISCSIRDYSSPGVYKCGDDLLNYSEVYSSDFDKQNTCQFRTVTNNKLLEEAGAEYFVNAVYGKKKYKTYLRDIEVYVMLQYILQSDFYGVQYSYNKEYNLFKLLEKEPGFGYNRVLELFETMNKVTEIDYGSIKDMEEKSYVLYKIADELIELYNAKRGQRAWSEDEFFSAGIYSIVAGAEESLVREYINKKGGEIKHLDELSSVNAKVALYKMLNENLSDLSYNELLVCYFFRTNNTPRIIVDVFDTGVKLKSSVEITFNSDGKAASSRKVNTEETE